MHLILCAAGLLSTFPSEIIGRECSMAASPRCVVDSTHVISEQFKAFDDYVRRNNIVASISWSAPALKTGPNGAQKWTMSVYCA